MHLLLTVMCQSRPVLWCIPQRRALFIRVSSRPDRQLILGSIFRIYKGGSGEGLLKSSSTPVRDYEAVTMNRPYLSDPFIYHLKLADDDLLL